MQDITSSYQIGQIFDAGMLHPGSTYALWRRTIRERNIPYMQLRQGMTVTLSSQTMLQVLWPITLLHSSSDANRDSALVLHLLAPGLSLLLLGEASYSTYALNGVLSSIGSNPMRADIVEVIGDVTKTFPTTLAEVMQIVRPTMLIVTPGTLPRKQHTNTGTTASVTPPTTALPVAALAPLITGMPVRVMQTAQVGTLEISSNATGWSMQSA